MKFVFFQIPIIVIHNNLNVTNSISVANLDTLIKTGLYLNDLSMHDFSRDMVLAGQQQSAELKLALDQELRKSRQLEITIRKLDEERRRSDELLYQMISCSHLLD